MWLFWLFPGILAALWLFAIGGLIWQKLPRSPEAELERLLTRFDDAHRDKSFADRQALKRILLALATVRDRASKRVEQSPGRAAEIIADEIETEAWNIGSVDRKLAKTFADGASTLGESDILYRDACRAVDAHRKRMRKAQARMPQRPDPHLERRIASLRVRH